MNKIIVRYYNFFIHSFEFVCTSAASSIYYILKKKKKKIQTFIVVYHCPLTNMVSKHVDAPSMLHFCTSDRRIFPPPSLFSVVKRSKDNPSSQIRLLYGTCEVPYTLANVHLRSDKDVYLVVEGHLYQPLDELMLRYLDGNMGTADVLEHRVQVYEHEVRVDGLHIDYLYQDELREWNRACHTWSQACIQSYTLDVDTSEDPNLQECTTIRVEDLLQRVLRWLYASPDAFRAVYDEEVGYPEVAIVSNGEQVWTFTVRSLCVHDVHVPLLDDGEPQTTTHVVTTVNTDVVATTSTAAVDTSTVVSPEPSANLADDDLSILHSAQLVLTCLMHIVQHYIWMVLAWVRASVLGSQKG